MNWHDIKAVASHLVEDADVITVPVHGCGVAKNLRKTTAKVMQAYSSILTSDGVKVKFIRGDIAIVTGEWSIAGVKELDGTPRKHQKGRFTWVLEKRQEVWWVIAVQNTFVR